MNNDLAEKEFSAFVGPKADYYLERWRFAVDSPEVATGFNWAAFFLSGLWLPYRKMYRIAGIFFGVILLESVLEEVVWVGIFGKPEAPAAFGRLFGLATSIVCGWLANEWYLSSARKAISEVRSQGLSEEAHLEALAKRGGTNLAASLGFLVIFLLASFAALILLKLFLKGGALI
jgi:hypothetical protein